MRSGAITLAYLYPDHVAGAFCDSIARMAASPHGWRVFDAERGGGCISFSCGPRVASGRNKLVETFLDQCEGEWLMMIDSDHSFAPDAIERLLAVADPLAAPVVGGLCFAGGRSGSIVPTMYVIQPKAADSTKGITLGVVQEWEPGELRQVHVTGAAFLLMHRTTLEAMRTAFAHTAPMLWFAEGLHDGVEYGEDFFFCIRLQQMGLPVYVATGVEAPHHKVRPMDHYDFAAWKLDRDRYGEAQLVEAAKHKRMGEPYELVEVVAPAPATNRAQRRAQQRRAQ